MEMEKLSKDFICSLVEKANIWVHSNHLINIDPRNSHACTQQTYIATRTFKDIGMKPTQCQPTKIMHPLYGKRVDTSHHIKSRDSSPRWGFMCQSFYSLSNFRQCPTILISICFLNIKKRNMHETNFETTKSLSQS